jgi:hypothetical protein
VHVRGCFRGRLDGLMYDGSERVNAEFLLKLRSRLPPKIA